MLQDFETVIVKEWWYIFKQIGQVDHFLARSGIDMKLLTLFFLGFYLFLIRRRDKCT